MPKKSPTQQGLHAIPLPEVIQQAFSELPERDAGVSHRKRARLPGDSNEFSELAPLTAENHAFYLGKLFPESFGARLREVLGWGKIEKRTYSNETLLGMLDYAFRHSNGQPQFIVGRSLSELFNGPKDVEGAFSAEDEKQHIQEVALHHFHRPVHVCEMEEMKQHHELFSVLRNNINPETGRVDFEKAMAFVDEKMKDMENSMQISYSLLFANTLYKAFKEDERFRGAISSILPRRLRQGDECRDSNYYSLTEIAIRLSDIVMDERFIHGGIDRQAYYDDIIEKILRGKKGGYKNIRALHSIFNLLENKRKFETIHLKNKEHYFERKKMRTIARYRLALISAMSLSISGGLLAGGYGIRRHLEEIEREEKIARMNDEIGDGLHNQDIHFPDAILRTVSMSKESKVDVMNQIVQNAMDIMTERYGLKDDDMPFLKPLLKQFFLNHSDSLDAIYGGNDFELMDQIDLFIQKNKLFLIAQGIEVGAPFDYLLSYQNHFKALLNSDEDIHVPANQTLEPLGHFLSAESFNSYYQFFWHNASDGRRYLVAKRASYMSDGDRFISSEYSSLNAKHGAAQFLYALRRYFALPLKEKESLFHDTSVRNYRKDDSSSVCFRMEEKSDYARFVFKNKMHSFRDPVTGDAFEWYIGTDYNEKTAGSTDCLMVKKPGDAVFTSRAGYDFANFYTALDSQWYPYHLGEPSGLSTE